MNSYAKHISQLIEHSNVDVIFSPGTIPIAYLRSNLPVVFWTDATFAGMIDFYPETANLCSETMLDGNFLEQEALNNCSLAIYSSDWAADSAKSNYQTIESKIQVVPFGANMDCDRTLDDIKAIALAKDFEKCNLLFLGVDWNRKGGDVAVAVAQQLHNRGVNVELSVVGCIPPKDTPSFVKNYGFISKKSNEGLVLLRQLFCDSHFLILPSRAECLGVVFAEASSYGLPSLGTQVGGIPTVIEDDVNGKTFPLDATPDHYCDYIQDLMRSKDGYYNLAQSSFKLYSSRLNWKVAGGMVYHLIENLSINNK